MTEIMKLRLVVVYSSYADAEAKKSRTIYIVGIMEKLLILLGWLGFLGRFRVYYKYILCNPILI
jgi:hypothetical protein